jgi:hypothetical protein
MVQMCMISSLIMKIEVVRSPETSINFHTTTQRLVAKIDTVVKTSDPTYIFFPSDVEESEV